MDTATCSRGLFKPIWERGLGRLPSHTAKKKVPQGRLRSPRRSLCSAHTSFPPSLLVAGKPRALSRTTGFRRTRIFLLAQSQHPPSMWLGVQERIQPMPTELHTPRRGGSPSGTEGGHPPLCSGHWSLGCPWLSSVTRVRGHPG